MTAASAPPSGSELADEVETDAWVSVRNQVIDRLVNFNRNHAERAWQAAPAPMCPHAVAFLFADPIEMIDERTGAVGQRVWRVAAATYATVDSPDVRELPDLLYRLARLARDRYLPTPGGFDPKTHMAIYADPTSGHASYLGLGVSTLDTLTRSWEEASRDAADIDDIGGRAYALLADGTAIITDRAPARGARAELGIHSTGQLEYPNDLTPRLWTHHPSVASMPAGLEVWDVVHQLHAVTYQQNPRPTL